MTPQQFRRLALALPQTEERAHMRHPDFRVGGKIFATLGYPNEAYGVVLLSPADQKRFVEEQPEVFAPVKGAWGRRGNTQVLLSRADAETLKQALENAWQHVAPRGD